MIERQFYYPAVSGVLRHAQTSVSQHHTSVQSLGCVLAGRMQREIDDSYRVRDELGVTVNRLWCRLRGTDQ